MIPIKLMVCMWYIKDYVLKWWTPPHRVAVVCCNLLYPWTSVCYTGASKCHSCAYPSRTGTTTLAAGTSSCTFSRKGREEKKREERKKKEVIIFSAN